MKTCLVKSNNIINPGDRTVGEVEPAIDDLRFHVQQVTVRNRPEDPRRHLIIPCFSEFGSEIIASMYCIPRLAQIFPGHYKTIIGWHGRSHLYQHLADEFWELGEEFMWLREYSRAFHHESENLKKFEAQLRGKGVVVSAQTMGRNALATQCHNCWRFWPDTKRTTKCEFCKSKNIRVSLYSDTEAAKEHAILPPAPSESKMQRARELLGPRPVGVFARARKCYGRNLPEDFYKGLVNRLESMGYTPIWLGEKTTTLPCPVDHIIDFSQTEESRDLETTLAIVKQCEFTVQFWTASTRLAAMVKTPYLLFESPDQLWGRGQEGYRLDLVTTGKRKLSANHFLNVYNDHQAGLDMVERCVREMERGDFSDVIGMVDKPEIVQAQRRQYSFRHIPEISS